MFSISNKFSVFGPAAQTKSPEVGNSVRDTRFNNSLFTSPQMQQKVEQGFRDKLNWAYSTISQLTDKGVAALRAPIKAMHNLNLPRIAIRDNMSRNSEAFHDFANKMISYHENVIKASEKIARITGDKTHAFVCLALNPVRFVVKILRIESVGAFIQNSIALVVGFIVRGIVMTTMQLGHALPYAVSGGIASALVIGIAVLAIKVSPLAALGVTFALILSGQQAQIIEHDKSVDLLAKVAKYQLLQTAKLKKDLAKNRSTTKTVFAILGAIGTLGYFYGADAARYITSNGAYQRLANSLTEQYNVISEYSELITR
jgi:hypothetical protein